MRGLQSCDLQWLLRGMSHAMRGGQCGVTPSKNNCPNIVRRYECDKTLFEFVTKMRPYWSSSSCSGRPILRCPAPSRPVMTPTTAFFDCTAISALCFQLFQDIEECHGRHLVCATFAYISLARFGGVGESKLFELRSLSDDVLAVVCVSFISSSTMPPPPPLHSSYFAVTRRLCQLIAPCLPAACCSC